MKFQNNTILLGFLFSIIGTALFSLKSIFIKLAYIEGLNADSVLLMRMLIALPIYAGIAWYFLYTHRVHTSQLTKRLKLIAFLGFIGYFVSSLLDLKGLEYISASLERLTLFTYPAFTVILGSIFFGIAITKRVVFALCMTYIGLIIALIGELEFNDFALLGVGLVLIAALTFSYYVLIAKTLIMELGSIIFTAVAMTISSIFGIIYALIMIDVNTLIITPEAWLWLGCLAIFSTVIPSFIISMALGRISAAHNGIVGMLGPLMTIFLAVILLNEPFDTRYVIAIGLIIFGIFILTITSEQS